MPDIHIHTCYMFVSAYTHTNTHPVVKCVYSTEPPLHAPPFLSFFFAATETSDRGLKIYSYVLNWGHTSNPQYIINEWRTETITGKFVEWLRWPEATELATWTGLIRVDHAAQIGSPLTPYYMVEVIFSDETVAKRGFNQHLIGKKKNLGDSDTCQNPVKEEHTDTQKYTHV